MERCHGKTKAGERCKRAAPEGSLYCGLHAEQSTGAPDEPVVSAESADERGLFETFVVVAAAGLALGAILTFRRVFRLI